MRAVLDPNVLISALLSPAGAPARTLRAWRDGRFELVLSPLLLAELRRALGYPKLRKRIGREDAVRLLEWLERTATVRPDPAGPPAHRSRDPGDDYLVALAGAERAALVSGDDHLLQLRATIPIFAPSDFLAFLERRER